MYHQLKGTQFLQRIGVLASEKTPQPAMEPGAWKVHSLPLSRPLPNAEDVEYLNGDPAPDRVVTKSWPYPET